MSTGLEPLTTEVKQLVSKYGKERNALMPILHELQKKHRKIPDRAEEIIADMLDMYAVEVQEVVSFFHFYNTKQHGQFTIRLCKDMPCKMHEAQMLANQLEEELGIKFGETTTDGVFSLEWTSCIGMCDQGPAMLVNDQPHTRVKPEEVRSILEKYKQEAK